MTSETELNNVEQNRPIEYLSAPAAVSMGDDWYQYATPEHFWMRRRFAVLRRLVAIEIGTSWAEVGCGHGAVQDQMHTELGIPVDGIDLNEYALKQNVSGAGRLFCYNVYEKQPALYQGYDNILLFDVIEHLSDDGTFLDASLHLLQPGGSLIINVPAFMHLYSKYDVAAGHVRRYVHSDIQALADQHGLTLQAWTYWGAPFIPLLVARKAFLSVFNSKNIIRDGFKPPSRWLNRLLAWTSRLERIPQHLYGTSLMAVLRKSA